MKGDACVKLYFHETRGERDGLSRLASASAAAAEGCIRFCHRVLCCSLKRPACASSHVKIVEWQGQGAQLYSRLRRGTIAEQPYSRLREAARFALVSRDGRGHVRAPVLPVQAPEGAAPSVSCHLNATRSLPPVREQR